MRFNQADAHSLVKLALEHWHDVMIYDGVGNISSNPGALPTSFASDTNGQSLQDNICMGNFGPNPVHTVNSTTVAGSCGFGPPSDDIYLGCTQGSSGSENAYALQASLPSNPLMLDDCVEGQTILFSEDHGLHQYLDSDVLSQSLVAVGSPADLGTAVTGFLAMSAKSAARDKANTVWGILSFVLRWRCSIKKIVATKRRVHLKERFD